MRSAIEDTTSCRGKSQEIEHDGQLGRKLREMTVRGGEAGLRQKQNKELTTKRAPIDLTHPSKNSQTSN